MIISLKPIPENEVDSTLKLNVQTHTIDSAYEKYNNAILDVFDHELGMEEDSLSLGSLVDHNLKYEYRYIRFIEDIYKFNDCKSVIIESHLNELENIDILRIMNGLDYKDKLLFIDLIRFNKSNLHIFSIEDKELLNLFVKLSTRELLFSVFHFTNNPITIVGNYDLSFPMFFNSEKDLKEYLSIARKNDLFFRNIYFSS